MEVIFKKFSPIYFRSLWQDSFHSLILYDFTVNKMINELKSAVVGVFTCRRPFVLVGFVALLAEVFQTRGNWRFKVFRGWRWLGMLRSWGAEVLKGWGWRNRSASLDWRLLWRSISALKLLRSRIERRTFRLFIFKSAGVIWLSSLHEVMLDGREFLFSF